MVPNGWKMTPVSELCTLQNGHSFKPKDWDTKGLPIIRIQNLNGSKNFNYFSGEPQDRWIIENGQMLFSWAGTKGVSFGPFIWKGEKGVLNQHIYKVLSKKKVNKEWLFYILKHVTESIEEKAHGFKSTLVHVKKSDIDGHIVPLPPLLEQQKIVQTLTTWDKAISTTERLIDNSKQQKKALMQQLLTGKKRLLDDNGKPFEGEWEEGKLADFSKIKKGKALSKKNIIEGSYPVIAGGKSSPYSHNDFTHENVITVSASGAYAGYVAFFDYKIWASDCSVVEPKTNSDIKFLYYWLRSQQQRIYNLQSGGAQPHIYPKDLEGMKINLPPLKEQQKIAAVLTNADKEIELLEQQLADLQQEKKALMQVLLTGKVRVGV